MFYGRVVGQVVLRGFDLEEELRSAALSSAVSFLSEQDRA
jgi:hypothetical protein